MLSFKKPEPSEFDAMTDLRNSHRQWFGDDQEISLEDGRRWLSSRTVEDALYAICWNGRIIGTIGWRDMDAQSSEIGRIIVDPGLRQHSGATGDIALTALTWAIESVETRGKRIFISVKPNNCACLSLCIRMGLSPSTHHALPLHYVTWERRPRSMRLAA
jgi:hypothetical protein